VHLTLHLTTACNMRCGYCYAPPRAGPVMSAETGRAVLAFGAVMNPGRSCGIIFFGGEPLLCRPLIEDLVGDARKREAEGQGRFHFKITTNGLLLDEAFLEFAVREDLLVGMSMDGIAAAHDCHRRDPGGAPTFERLLPNLRLLLAARPYSSVLTVISPETVAHVAESVQFLVELGVRYLVISLNYAGPWTEETLEELRCQLERLGELYLTWTREGRKFYLSPFEMKLASHVKGADARCLQCELGMRQLSVDPDGYLYPCVQFTRTGPEGPWCLGHVKTGVDEKRRTRLRDASQREKKPCAQCAIRTRCNHTCGCLNWQTTGDVARVSPVLCRFEQMLLPIADRVGETLYAERNPHFIQKHYNPAYPVLSLMEDVLAG